MHGGRGQTNRPLATVAIALALFMAALEMTVVSTAMPTVVGDLGGLEHYAWVFTGYMLASTVTVPIFGKLADLYGRKPVMLVGIGLFLAGSLASGTATSMGALIAFRAIQGLGAGAIQPLAMTIAADLYSLEQRARIQGLFSSVWGVSALVGPALGAFIVKVTTWRWVFLVNLPVGLATAAMLFFFFHERVEHRRHALDVAGAALMSLAVVSLLWGVQPGAGDRWALLASAAFIALLVWQERRAPEPLIPPALFRIRAVALSSVLGALSSAAMFGAVTFVPLYIQGVLRGSPMEAGGMITPMMVGWPVASTLGGRLLPKVGFRPLVVGGLGVTAAAMFGLAFFLVPGAASLRIPWISMAAFGVGMGFSATALLLIVQSSVGWEMRGIATASAMFFRNIGGAIGVGVMGGVMAAALARDPSLPADAADRLLSQARTLPPELVERLGATLQSGLRTNFWLAFGCAALAFAASVLFPRVPVHGNDSADTDPAGV